MSFAAIGRGNDLLAVDEVAPQHERLRVRYHRATCTEHYLVSPEGLAMSFVFDRLPAGEDDLVVRLRVTSELPLVAASDKGLRFEAAGLGGVTIGGVTGIDALGRRCAGSITSDGHGVELRLPHTFLAEAALPLVLDPQVGAVFAVTNSSLDYSRPKVCGRGLSPASFFCVFEREFSAVDHDIRAVRLLDDGTVFGSLLLITSSAGSDEVAPVAGTVTVNKYYVVVYRRGTSLFAKSVSFTGTIGTEITAVSTTDTLPAPTVGGELNNVDNDVICAYHNQTQNRIDAIQIQVGTSGALNTFAPVTLGTGTLFSTVGSPRISHHDGLVGRYLVAYSSHINGGTTSPRGVVIDRNINVLDSV